MPNIDGPRACTKAELAKVIAIVDQAMREGIDQTVLTDYPLVYLEKNLENIRILKVDGELAAEVPVLPRNVVLDDCQFTIGDISPTATAPHHRMKGYGLHCVNSCVEVMRQIGCELSVLWTLVRTFPFYEKGGYQAIRSQGWIYRCLREDAGLFQEHGEDVVELNPAMRNHIDAIRRMHEREIYGVLRAPEEYPFLFALPKMRTLIALRSQIPVAYLMVSRAVNKPGLIEAGGDKQAVETLVNRALLELEGSRHWDAYAYQTETVLGHLLQQKLPQRRQPFYAPGASSGGMMVRINHAAAFFRKIAKWFEKKNAGRPREFSLDITDANERISFHFARGRLELASYKLDSHLEMSRRELTSAIFGAHPDRPSPVPDALRDLVPFYFPVWMLDIS